MIGALAIPGYLEINIEKDIGGLENVKNLGVGGTAFIIRAKLVAPHLIVKHGINDVAIKIMNENATSKGMIEETRRSFLYEVAIMSSLPVSPNIVRLIGYSNKDPMAIVMKFYPLSLKEMFKRSDFVVTSDVALKIALDISTGLSVIHKQGILHLDIKPRK